MSKSTGNAITDRLNARFEFADLICSAMKRQVSVALLEVGPDDRSYVGISGWAGDYPERPAKSPFKSPFLASAKALELYWRGNRGELTLTPIVELAKLSTGFMGGARLEQSIVGVSHWEQQHDLLLALIVLYSFEYETRLHHIGWRMESEEAWQRACDHEAEQGFRGANLPASDHQRMYFWHPDPRSPNGGYHVEYQLFQENHVPAVHIDVAVGDPERFLRFMARGLSITQGMKLDIWEDEAPNPYGVAWAIGDDQSQMGVMARERWDYFVPDTTPKAKRIVLTAP